MFDEMPRLFQGRKGVVKIWSRVFGSGVERSGNHFSKPQVSGPGPGPGRANMDSPYTKRVTRFEKIVVMGLGPNKKCLGFGYGVRGFD